DRAAARELSLFDADESPAHYFSPTAAKDAEASRELLATSPWPPPGLSEVTLRGLPPELMAEFAAETPAAGKTYAPKLFTRSTKIVTTGVLVAITAWAALGVQKDDYNAWHFTREKFFGKDTYAGGADKCSHFILSAFLARELGWVYEKQDHPPDQSYALSLGVTVLAGVIQEIGDAFTPYGYSWEDITADTLGGVAGAALSYYRLNDLIGLRFGFIQENVPPATCCVESLGENYSHEIYSGDLKIAGLAQRMHFNPGIARFLLLSATYSTKAYGHDPARPDRQRNVGMDIGLNLPEIMTAVGVPENTWWGTALYKALNLFRIPFTAFGVRYDMNHKKWHGPDTGQNFD
ncbi:MAG TPA: DUF2279 domain-containing protein, partial [Thermoanaerobaculia bacterium]